MAFLNICVARMEGSGHDGRERGEIGGDCWADLDGWFGFEFGLRGGHFFLFLFFVLTFGSWWCCWMEPCGKIMFVLDFFLEVGMDDSLDRYIDL